ncbi:hypothetical protein KFK09_008498 [Dendrobium nobile]|uniref:Uncharacterized protein n=1 Tax=Dendrobium nobile TaxID=94219 RepID=A0A8T3BQ48_DENNO|nr:hypothetical protein KFK09_008498 [Dendrobium nobile]
MIGSKARLGKSMGFESHERREGGGASALYWSLGTRRRREIGLRLLSLEESGSNHRD